MAELILTEEEKGTLWSDLDDATLGKVVKKHISALTSASEQLERSTVVAAAIWMCAYVAENKKVGMSIDLEGVTDRDVDIGNWKVVIEKVEAKDVRSAMVEWVRAKDKERQAKEADLISKSLCPECEGEGEIGGQFSGGVQTCPECKGTGRY